MNEQEQKRQLLAYADGELAGQDKLAAQLAADPDTAGAVEHQVGLREAVARSLKESTPPMPAHLRDHIEQMAMPSKDQPVGRLGHNQFTRWAPAMAAAILLVASVAIYYQSNNRTPSPALTAAITPPIFMSANESSRFTKRHIACATMREQLHQADWPTSISELPVALTGHLNATPYQGLDLTKAGYQFAGAGPCMAPGEPSAHLLYRALDNKQKSPISLWLRPDDGRYDIPQNMVHQVKTDGSANPIYIWRHNSIIYYMVGNSIDQAKQIRQSFTD